MGRLLHDAGHRQRADIVRRHGFIARQAAVFGRHLAGAVGERPWRVGQNRMKVFSPQRRGEIDDRPIELVHRPCMPLF
jgi:hypothetical protein